MIGNLSELIEKLNVAQLAMGDTPVRVQVDYPEEIDDEDIDPSGVILPIQSVEIGVDGRAYIRCFRKG